MDVLKIHDMLALARVSQKKLCKHGYKDCTPCLGITVNMISIGQDILGSSVS